MANASHTLTKKERRRVKVEQLRAAQRRRERRRTINFTLAAIAAIGIAVVAIVSLSGPGSSTGGGSIAPSATTEVSISGPPRTSMLAVGDTVPEFSAPGFHMQAASGGGYTIARDPVDWATYVGHPTVLSIWAPWCPHCQKELPVLSEAVSTFTNVRLVTVVTSIGREAGPTPNGYLADHGLTFPAGIDDANGTLARALGVRAFPTVYLVDSSGRVAFAGEGEVPPAQLRAELAKLS